MWGLSDSVKVAQGGLGLELVGEGFTASRLRKGREAGTMAFCVFPCLHLLGASCPQFWHFAWFLLQ